MKDEKLHADLGILTSDDGRSAPARFYRGDDETPGWGERVDREHHTTWREPDGAIGIRRGTSVTVGATRSYSSKYDDVDWGN